MTEVEWLECNDPTALLEFIEKQASDRKLLLLAVACKRTMWKPRGKEAQAYNTLELVADMPNPLWEFEASLDEFDRYFGIGMSPWELAEVRACGPRVALGKLHGPPLVRDIFGNPFRPVAFSPAWRTDTALTLAKQMYASRDFSSMPVLADALQDAGCDSPDILDHCRGPGPHVRGCFVVDLLFDKK
jgi:hypothetical protein